MDLFSFFYYYTNTTILMKTKNNSENCMQVTERDIMVNCDSDQVAGHSVVLLAGVRQASYDHA